MIKLKYIMMIMKRLLILSYFYTPDTSPCAYRIGALVESLKQLNDSNIKIDILTTLPNRYANHASPAKQIEKDGNITITRFDTQKTGNSFKDQVKAWLKYRNAVMQHIKKQHYDLVFATSSKLMTGYLGAKIAKKQIIPFYLDIRDIFLDSMQHILNPAMKIVMLPVLKHIEKKTYRQANHLNIVSAGFMPYFQSKVSTDCQLTVIPNGIDELFLNRSFIKDEPSSPLKIIYAGNLGFGQGIHKIIPKLAKQIGEKACFEIYGNGAYKDALMSACKNIDNVKINEPIDRSKLLDVYQRADVLFLHLDKLDVFEKVLPSKIFEYAATGKPILAGVNGYAKQFLCEEVERSWVFNPCDDKQACEALENIICNQAPFAERKAFREKYARNYTSKQLRQGIMDLLQKPAE